MLTPNLTTQDFEKISQLTGEMKLFPPNYFTEENILSWSKYFNIAPQNLEEYTSRTSRILRLAENLLRQDQNLPFTEITPEEKEDEINEREICRTISPVPPPEAFNFLWLQTLLILSPQSDGTSLDNDFSPYFKMAAYLKTAEIALRDLKDFCDFYENPREKSEIYNATLTLIEELKTAIEKRDLENCRKIYQTFYSLNHHGLEPEEIKTILKRASLELKEQFLISEETSLQTTSGEDSHDETLSPEAFEHTLKTKIANVAQSFGEKDLTFFKNLDIKLDDIQKEAFVAQIKNLLLKISAEKTPDNQTL
jgi:hypothetical protein